MQPQNRRDSVIQLTQATAHLYALASALAHGADFGPEEQQAAFGQILHFLSEAQARLEDMPDCAHSMQEQSILLRALAHAQVESHELAMALARSGLIVNTWCTAATMLVSAQATDGPLTLGGLVQLMHRLQPDPRFQTALVDKLSGMALDTSAMHQLGSCYFQVQEAYSLIELSRLFHLGDTTSAADLLDAASRGAMIALRFLQRLPVAPAPPADATDHLDAIDSSDQSQDTSHIEVSDTDSAQSPPSEQASQTEYERMGTGDQLAPDGVSPGYIPC